MLLIKVYILYFMEFVNVRTELLINDYYSTIPYPETLPIKQLYTPISIKNVKCYWSQMTKNIIL